MEGATGRQRLPRNVLESLSFPLPPLPEQQKIASVLSVVQEAKEKTENVISALKELRKSMMKNLFTYGPVPIEETERVPLKETEIGMIPEHWEIKKVADLGKILTGNTPSTNRKEYYGDKYQFISPADLGITKYVYKSGKYLSDAGLQVSRPLPKDSVLVTCIGSTIGKTGMTVDEISTTNQQINSISCTESFNRHFIYYYLTFIADRIKAMASTVAVPILNKSNFEEIKVISPSLPEQQQIAESLSTIDDKLEAESKKINSLDSLFKTLLSLLMTGKIRVKDLEIPL
ncbi:MAG: restriction endonuclease subunit S [Nitrospirae bacterium]|nr:restriction endonuclease subunit S [Nitrospirota bacterium]